MTDLAMFPLGSVLFPHMPLSLRVFEERYLVMLSRVLQDEPSRFGVVLIERGQEVGGGEHRFSVGTVAQVAQLEAAEGFVGLVAEGSSRIVIDEWLDEDPHPQAKVTELPALEWDDGLQSLLERAEQLVRRSLARASEFSDLAWSAAVELSEEPVAHVWQLAAIAPLGPLDQIALLRSTSMNDLLEGIIEHTLGVEVDLDSSWPSDFDGIEGLDDLENGDDLEDDQF